MKGFENKEELQKTMYSRVSRIFDQIKNDFHEDDVKPFSEIIQVPHVSVQLIGIPERVKNLDSILQSELDRKGVISKIFRRKFYEYDVDDFNKPDIFIFISPEISQTPMINSDPKLRENFRKFVSSSSSGSCIYIHLVGNTCLRSKIHDQRNDNCKSFQSGILFGKGVTSKEYHDFALPFKRGNLLDYGSEFCRNEVSGLVDCIKKVSGWVKSPQLRMEKKDLLERIEFLRTCRRVDLEEEKEGRNRFELLSIKTENLELKILKLFL